VTPRAAPAEPESRRQQIMAAAAEQFRASGYHNVGIDDVAKAVGLTGPALYRHFRGKQQLLEATLETVADDFAAAYGQDHRDLRQLLETIATVSVRHRDRVILWQREANHLPPEKRRQIRGRFRSSLEPLRAMIARERPDLAGDDIELLVWGCQTVFASPSYNVVTLEPARTEDLLVEAATAVCRTPGLPRPAPYAATGRTVRGRYLPASRREAVVVAATRLFAERGYQAVSMDDIGAAAGITGPSLYHHFPSKSAILVTQLRRGLDAMMFDVSAALDLAESPAQALDLLLRSAVRTGMEHGGVVTTLLNEMVNIPAAERGGVRRMQREYVAEWVALLTAHRPALSTPEAETLVGAAQTVIGLLSQRPRLRRRPGFPEELVALGRGVLGLPDPLPAPNQRRGDPRRALEGGSTAPAV
jgi:AcrR family transcriptional regulator